jgi:divalent metal cation (Fe/Co/Zn/Cd) transporter
MSTFAVSRSAVERRIITLQWVTLCWMLVECSVALLSAWKARSISLLAFGSDSFVEIISAAVVLLQFNRRIHVSPVRAAKFCGLLLYGLAVVISIVAILGLSFRTEAATSPLGVAITAGALLLMPVLARLKRDAAARSGNKALRADAIQSATCAYLAALTLSGLLLRSAFGVRWLDQVVALAAVPILIIEARKAREGQVCGCC